MGFCLLNNVAIAAHEALRAGAQRVLVFDHDVHHGNGTQDIFYEDDRVLYQSFHLAPHYPGSGHVEDVGAGAGLGFTMNAPLRHGDGEQQVRSIVENVFLPAARAFRPDVILFSSGFDSLRGDPLGGLDLPPAFFGELVSRFRSVSPVLVAFLEGGYQLDLIPLAAREELRAMIAAPRAMQGRMQAPECEAALRERLADVWPTVR
jgi:acetoin utilization deacetylase AcuC-like enzyme